MKRGAGLGGGDERGAVPGLGRAQERPGAHERRQRRENGRRCISCLTGRLNETGRAWSMRWKLQPRTSRAKQASKLSLLMRSPVTLIWSVAPLGRMTNSKVQRPERVSSRRKAAS
jgi:hypothetical protein